MKLKKLIATNKKPRECLDCEKEIKLGDTCYIEVFDGRLYCEECGDELIKPIGNQS